MKRYFLVEVEMSGSDLTDEMRDKVQGRVDGLPNRVNVFALVDTYFEQRTGRDIHQSHEMFDRVTSGVVMGASVVTES